MMSFRLISYRVSSARPQRAGLCYDYSGGGLRCRAKGRETSPFWGLFSVGLKRSFFSFFFSFFFVQQQTRLRVFLEEPLAVQSCEFINLTSTGFCCGQDTCSHPCRGQNLPALPRLPRHCWKLYFKKLALNIMS